MKQILPPLDRIMSLMNINVFDWVNQISFKPKMFHKFVGNNLNTRDNAPSISIGGGLTTLTKFLVTTDCMLCGKKCDQDNGIKQGLCAICSKMDPQMIIKLKIKFKKYEKQYSQLLKVCKGCTLNIEYGDFNKKLDCNSLDCPNLYSCYTTQQHLDKHDYLREIIDEYF
jgi:DNA polymerase zeta